MVGAEESRDGSKGSRTGVTTALRRATVGWTMEVEVVGAEESRDGSKGSRTADTKALRVGDGPLWAGHKGVANRRYGSRTKHSCDW